MADKYIENSNIKVGINLHGAELVSLVRKSDDREYMWCGDAKYWGRVSPVLFPFVGKLEKQSYRNAGIEYDKIPQHGFARDCEFEVVDESHECIWFKLIKSDMLQEKYPFNYDLFIGYKIEDKTVKVMWRVENLSDEELHFSIGAHPAFNCEGMDKGRKYRLNFYTENKSINSGIINSDGVLSDRTKDLELQNGTLEMSQELFSEDALVFDSKVLGNGPYSVAIIDDSNTEFLKVDFEAPALGIWTPVGKNAPFVCIEPWYGRCDRAGFAGELKDREYGNTIKSNAKFEVEYSITVM